NKEYQNQAMLVQIEEFRHSGALLEDNEDRNNIKSLFQNEPKLCETEPINETYEKSAKDIQEELEHSSNFAEDNDLNGQNILG
ncbi:17481_t:CDS:2, partial [Racocetra persica]